MTTNLRLFGRIIPGLVAGGLAIGGWWWWELHAIREMTWQPGPSAKDFEITDSNRAVVVVPSRTSAPAESSVADPATSVNSASAPESTAGSAEPDGSSETIASALVAANVDRPAADDAGSPRQLPQRDESESVAAHPDDWPWMFGPNRDSHCRPDQIGFQWAPEPPRELWRATSGTGYSSPVVRDGKLILFFRRDDTELMQCLEAESGSVLWEASWPTSHQTKFSHYSNGPYSTPVIGQGTVFAVRAAGQIVAVDFTSGTRLWEQTYALDWKVPPAAYSTAASPLLADGLLFHNLGASSQNAGMIAMSPRTGEIVWKSSQQGRAYCTPLMFTIENQKKLLALTEDGLSSFSPVNGDVEWMIPFGIKGDQSKVNSVTPLRVGDDHVIVAAGPGRGGLCVKVPANGPASIVWQRRRDIADPQFTNLIYRDGYFYGFTALRASDFRCVNALTGEPAWSIESPAGRMMQLVVGDRAIVWGEHGQLGHVALTPNSPPEIQLVAEPLLGEKSYAMPAISRGRLYVRDENHVLCLDLRPQP
jgi:outer membrane protein assembly factor BamB